MQYSDPVLSSVSQQSRNCVEVWTLTDKDTLYLKQLHLPTKYVLLYIDYNHTNEMHIIYYIAKG